MPFFALGLFLKKCIQPLSLASSALSPNTQCYILYAVAQEIMKEWTKEVLRAQPVDIYAWSAKYFAEKAAAAKGGR